MSLKFLWLIILLKISFQNDDQPVTAETFLKQTSPADNVLIKTRMIQGMILYISLNWTTVINHKYKFNNFNLPLDVFKNEFLVYRYFR